MVMAIATIATAIAMMITTIGKTCDTGLVIAGMTIAALAWVQISELKSAARLVVPKVRQSEPMLARLRVTIAHVEDCLEDVGVNAFLKPTDPVAIVAAGSVFLRAGLHPRSPPEWLASTAALGLQSGQTCMVSLSSLLVRLALGN
jgi:hypothetical protein